MKISFVLLFVVFIPMAYGRQDVKPEASADHRCSMMKHEDGVKHPEGMKQDEEMSHGETMDHDAIVKRGEIAMGFSQTQTTHHFYLSPSGGAIEVQSKDASDTAARDRIRHHLQEIAKSFAQGDFSSPMLTHGKVPPGVPDMRRLKSSISYDYSETQRGAKVIIDTKNPAALKAVQEFFRFQIVEHETGDSKVVPSKAVQK
jgi:hypothetical protein